MGTLRCTTLLTLSLLALSFSFFESTIERCDALTIDIDVCILYDSHFIGIEETFEDEGFTMDQLLRFLEFNVIRIYTANNTLSWQVALSQCNILVIPENEAWIDIDGYIGGGIIEIIKQWTAEGGHIIQAGQGTKSSDEANAIYTFFGCWSRYVPKNKKRSGAPTIFLTPNGTAAASDSSSIFYEAPDQLGYVDAVWEYPFDSVPEEECYYHLDGECVVAHKRYFDGFLTSLGYDFYDAFPNGTQDGGWPDLVNQLIVRTPQPEVVVIPPVNETQVLPITPESRVALGFQGDTPNFVIYPLVENGNGGKEVTDIFVAQQFSELVIVEASGNQVLRIPIPSARFNRTQEQGDGVSTFSFTTTVLGLTLSLEMSLFDEADQDLSFAGIAFEADAGVLKWTLNLTQGPAKMGAPGMSFLLNVPIESSKNLLSVVKHSNTPKAKLTTYDLNLDGAIAKLTVFDVAKIDGNTRFIKHSVTSREVDGKTQAFVEFRFPFFAQSLTYDPNMAVLIDSGDVEDDGSGGGSDNTLLIVLTSVLGGVAIAVVVVAIIVGTVVIKTRAWKRTKRMSKRMLVMQLAEETALQVQAQLAAEEEKQV